MGIDIPGFIRLLREDDVAGALERIHRENPFPAICGRICPAPCEDACVFKEEGAPIAIRSLERYAADFGRGKAVKEKFVPLDKSTKVAIIGAGPAGLSAAHFLAHGGYGVTVYEASGEAGGLLRSIPEFRLPRKVLDEQAAELKSMGVRIATDAFVGGAMPVGDFLGQGYAALLLAVGAGAPDFTQMPGHNLGGVFYAEEFLMRPQRIVPGAKTAIIGGGAAALDAARVAIRRGQEADLIFEGMEEELGVDGDDLHAAVEEGVRLHAPVQALAIEADGNGFAAGVRCRQLEIAEKEGKFSLEPLADGQMTLAAKTVVLSRGRRPNQFLRKALPQLKWNENGTLWVDAHTGLTSMEKIFAAGNVATGAGPVVDAIASGKSAAKKIMEFLGK